MRAAIIEIINNTRGGIVIFFTANKRERGFFFRGGGANSSPGCRARRLLAELMLSYRFCGQNSTFYFRQSEMIFSILLRGKTFQKAEKLV